MPVLKHARKKQRQDKKRTADNLKIKQTFKNLIKLAKEKKTTESLSTAFSGIDKAVKKNIIHKNKAARLKSGLAKHIKSVEPKKTSVTPKSKKVKTVKKTSNKK